MRLRFGALLIITITLMGAQCQTTVSSYHIASGHISWSRSTLSVKGQRKSTPLSAAWPSTLRSSTPTSRGTYLLRQIVRDRPELLHASSIPAATTTLPIHAMVSPPSIASAPSANLPPDMAAWEKVAICEEGGDWIYDGPVYSGGLGISRTNWDAYGGQQFAPERAQATPEQQATIGQRIEGSSFVPDQNGCAAW